MGIILKQGVKNTLITYLGIAIGFVNTIIVQPHFLSSEEIGLTRILYSFSMLLAIFMPMGATNITIRYFPIFRNEKNGHQGYFGFMLIFPLIGFLISSFFLYIFRDVIIAQYSKEAKLFTDFFYYIFPLSFFLCLVVVINAYCSSIFKSSVPTFLNDILVRLLSMILFSIYFIRWININTLIIFFVGIYGIQLLVLLFYTFKVGQPSFKINFSFFKKQPLKKMMAYGFLLSIGSVSTLGIKYIDSLMLATYLPLAIVGVYSLVAFIPTFIEAPINAIDRIASPKVSDAWVNNDMDLIKEIYIRSSKYLILIGGILFLGVITNISALLKMLPPDFYLGINVVYILSTGAFINMLTGLNNAIIFNSKNYLIGICLLFSMLIVTIICNLIFIPLYGIEGAAIAAVMGSVSYNLLKYTYIYIKYKIQPFDSLHFKIIGFIIVCLFINFKFAGFKLPIVEIATRSLVIIFSYSIFSYFIIRNDPTFQSFLMAIKSRNPFSK